MYFLTYMRRELRHRMRQAIFIALGLALGVGLVVIVGAASDGVKAAQSKELRSLYGLGTAITVTGALSPPPASPPKNATSIEGGPNGAEVCTDGKCASAAGKTVDNLNNLYASITMSKVAEVARLDDVASAAGGIKLSDTVFSFPKHDSGGGLTLPSTYNVDGVDTSHPSLSPLGSAKLISGHSLTAANADSDVVVLDSDFAASHSLKVGSVVTIHYVKFKVIGIVRQSQASTPPDEYISLRAAQDLNVEPASMKNQVNTVYVTAASAADISTVSSELSKLLPGSTLSTESSLASEVTGSVSSAGKLINDLGTWLAVLVLIAAFAVACLLTLAAVGRRVREFGTLKAIGWRTRRIVAQVLGESAVTGIVGAALGVGVGFGGAAIIAAVAPKLSATYTGNNAAQAVVGSGPVPTGPGGAPTSTAGSAHPVYFPLHPSVTVGVIVLAVVLAIVGGLLAGAVGSWRIGKLRPADALSRVA